MTTKPGMSIVEHSVLEVTGCYTTHPEPYFASAKCKMNREWT